MKQMQIEKLSYFLIIVSLIGHFLSINAQGIENTTRFLLIYNFLLISMVGLILMWKKIERLNFKKRIDSKKRVIMHISETGRVWVDANEVVKSDSFQRQLNAVSRMRQAKEERKM